MIWKLKSSSFSVFAAFSWKLTWPVLPLRAYRYQTALDRMVLRKGQQIVLYKNGSTTSAQGRAWLKASGVLVHTIIGINLVTWWIFPEVIIGQLTMTLRKAENLNTDVDSTIGLHIRRHRYPCYSGSLVVEYKVSNFNAKENKSVVDPRSFTSRHCRSFKMMKIFVK